MSLKKEIQEILHPHDGTPQMSDERGVELPTIESLDDTPLEALDQNIFDKIAHNTDFQRLVTWIIKLVDPMFKGVTTRNNKLMISQINERAIIANKFTKLVRGSKMDYKECMNELELVLKERAERLK